MIDPEQTIICRCEDITLARLRAVLESGITDIEEVKRILRCGMGLCQGRTCLPMIEREIAGFLNVENWQVGIPAVRQPIQPLKFSSILESLHEE